MGSLGNMFHGAREKIKELVWGAPRVTLAVASIARPDPPDPDREEGMMCRAGDDVVCDGPEQHLIATACEDIAIGDTSERINEQFHWFQAPPALGTEFLKIACAHCDGRWVSSGMHLHFKGGWR